VKSGAVSCPVLSRNDFELTHGAVFVYVFPTSRLVGLVCQNRHTRFSIINIFKLLLVALLFLVLKITYYLSVCKIATILLQIFELIGYGAKALFPEEFMWFEDLGLANEEVASLQLKVFC
jgi:hypothetical protein